MTTLTIELHSDLAGWIEQTAAARGLSLEAATSRLLDEARMRDVGLTRIVTPGPANQLWFARTPMRGLTYIGYDMNWKLMSAEAAQAALLE
jgi:hypothetical protein